jgi:hypothetical protein
MGKYIHQSKGYKGSTRIRIIMKEGREVKGIEHIGVAHNEAEKRMFLALAREKLKDERQEELRFREFEGERESEIIHKKSYSKYLYETISKVYDKLKLNEVGDIIFKQIVIARIIKPSSKLETVEILKKVELEYRVSNSGIWRCLRRAIKEGYREKISDRFIEYIGIGRATLLLYDVTTLYFEIGKEDEYRKSGLSKERRLEPQIVVGLLVDEKGFPLGISSFEGNKAETKTMLPVLKEFREKCKVKELTVVADAAMMSGDNLGRLEKEGFKFIIGSRIAKTPYEIEEYRKREAEKLEDGEIFDTKKRFKSKENKKGIKRRVIYQYRQKRADLDLRNIEKQIKKARKAIENNLLNRRVRFLKISQAEKELDEDLIKEAKLRAGIKGYVTNLKGGAKKIIEGYHNLFNVERSFRMSKTDLRTRPIFHQKRDSIEAHLTVCFAALGICRYIQERTKISIKRFINRLAELQTAIIEIAGKKHIAKPEIDTETRNIVKLLE